MQRREHLPKPRFLIDGKQVSEDTAKQHYIATTGRSLPPRLNVFTLLQSSRHMDRTSAQVLIIKAGIELRGEDGPL